MSDKIKKTSPQDNARALIQRMAPEIAKALPRHVTPERMTRIALTAVSKTPKLAECSSVSLIGSILTAAQLGLEPNTPLGECYLIPYKNTCQLIVGYQGMMTLARRSKEVAAIYAYAVRDGDTFEERLGLKPDLVHVPSKDADRLAKKITHVYAVAQLVNGTSLFRVLSFAEIEARRVRGASGAGHSTPWDTDYEAMALKSAVRALFAWIPRTPEMAQAVAHEDAVDAGEAPALDDGLRAALEAEGVEMPRKNEDAIAALNASIAHDTVTGEVVDDEAEQAERYFAAKATRADEGAR
jgi:recombination protein RecT